MEGWNTAHIGANYFEGAIHLTFYCFMLNWYYWAPVKKQARSNPSKKNLINSKPPKKKIENKILVEK